MKMRIGQLFFMSLLVMSTIVFNFAHAQSIAFPVPAGGAKQLFFYSVHLIAIPLLMN